MPRLALALVGLALLTVAPAAWGEAPPSPTSTPSPEEQLSARLDALPTPEAAGPFTFESAVFMGEERFGHVSMRATPTTVPEGAPGWRIEEAWDLAGGSMKRSVKALLDRRLQPVRGTLLQRAPDGEPATRVWERVEGGFRTAKTAKDLGAAALQPYAEGDCLTATVSIFLFCHLALPEPGSFRTQVFAPGKDDMEAAAWDIVGEGTFDGQAAWLVRGQKVEVKLEAGFDKETKALLGARFVQPGISDMSFRPKGPENPKTEEDPAFEAPASSARGAAMTAALAFAAGDVDLLDEIVHWPSVHAAMKAAYDAANAGRADADPYPGVEGLRELVLGKLRGSLVKRPRGMIEMGVRMVAAQLVSEEIEGGLTRVKFPETFGSMVLDVGPIDGRWFLARLPAK